MLAPIKCGLHITNSKSLRTARKLSKIINLVTAIRMNEPCWVINLTPVNPLANHNCSHSFLLWNAVRHAKMGASTPSYEKRTLMRQLLFSRCLTRYSHSNAARLTEPWHTKPLFLATVSQYENTLTSPFSELFTSPLSGYPVLLGRGNQVGVS